MENKFKRVVPDDIKASDLKPLQVQCSSTKCNENLHCFSRWMNLAEKRYGKKGVCYKCGEGTIDWGRIHKKDENDFEYIYESLNKELIRYVFWQTKIEKVVLQDARKSNKTNLRNEARKILEKRIGKYNSFIDGKQTPKGKNIINYAQHGTATCCRQCLEAWYNIPKNQNLTELQLEFCTDLIMLYISERIPDLKQ